MAEYDDSFFKKETWFHVILSVRSMWFLWYLVPGVSWASSLGVYIWYPVIKINLWLHDYMLLFEKKKKSFALPSCLPASRKRKQSTQVPQLDSISALYPCVQWSRLLSEIKAQGLQNSQPFPLLDFLAQPFYIQVVSVSGFKYRRILFLFSFVLKSEVLKEWGAFPPLYGLYGVKTPI